MSREPELRGGQTFDRAESLMRASAREQLAQSRGVGIAEHDDSRGRLVQAGGHIEERALAGPGRAGDRGEGSRLKLHADPIQSHDHRIATAMDLANVVESNRRRRRHRAIGAGSEVA
jgi:hypothetical protein